jgi:hypothetical protein
MRPLFFRSGREAQNQKGRDDGGKRSGLEINQMGRET